MNAIKCVTFILFTMYTIRTEATPEISQTYTKVATLNETASAITELSVIECTDPDKDPVRVYIKSMTPNTPCTNCFKILDCPSSTAKCLQFRPGTGILDYGSAQTYVITFACTDDIEPPVTGVIEVKIIPNKPPIFKPDTKYNNDTLSSTSAAGSPIYDVNAEDLDGDIVTYSMRVIPASSSSNYVIDKTSGVITNTVDMRKECRNDVTFEVTISDGKDTVGPLVINRRILNPNVAPVATNLDVPVQVPEDKTDVYTMFINDPNPGDTVTYTKTSGNTQGLNQYTFGAVSANEAKITANGALNYEKGVVVRQTDVEIQATDGYCTSSKYKLLLQVTDVNEPPVIIPGTAQLQLCEGQHEINPGFLVQDNDTDDYYIWSLHSSTDNSGGYFTIDPSTGIIKMLQEYDVDVPGPFPSPKVFTVQASDKGRLTATAALTVTFLDCNDNAPVFEKPAYTTYEPTECLAPGTTLGLKVKATDKDSSREQNNNIYYEGSGGSVVMRPNGDLVVVQPLPAGSVETLVIYAYDRGVTPGQQKSKNPTYVTVVFGPCPTTKPPTSAVTSTGSAPTGSAITVSSTTTKGEENILPWVIVAGILGALLLGLFCFMCWRYGHNCSRVCGRWGCNKQCCKASPTRATSQAERWQTDLSQREAGRRAIH
ncbi:unnamed protein product [Lymnaea stagnalis]|uniref:Cadherin domain-containing protein n=1 Tax=Lymnaea stagnalis TaxID=6523 RepID=A0AAV2I8E5_LYMST